MDLNKIIKESNNNISESRPGMSHSAELASESVQNAQPIVQAGQEAPSLVAPIQEMRREVKMLNKKGELAIKLLAGLKQKNLGDLATRNQIFKICNTRNESGQTFFTQVYESQNEAAICMVEETLNIMLHTPVCIGSQTVSGIFQLLEVLKPEAMDSVAAYILDAIEALKPEEALHGRQSRLGEEAICRQLSLYFLYGFLRQNNAVLEAVTDLIKSQDEGVQTQFETIIRAIVTYVLNDFEKPYCRVYFTSSSIYDSRLLYACKNYPVLLQELYAELLAHFLKEDSQAKLVDLLTLPTAEHFCFLNLIYSKLNPNVSISLDREFLHAFEQLEEWFHKNNQLAYLIPIFRNLQLPHLLNYLLKIPLEIFGKDEKMRYFFFSICLKHLDCIHRFKPIRIEAEEAADYFQLVIIKVFQDLFELSNTGDRLDRSLEENLFQTPATTAPKELFFTILESLKSLNVLENLSLITILLSNSLNYDIKQKPLNSIFDYVLENLIRLGFDLSFKEPVKQGNLIFEAFDLENIDLIQKLIELGVNPFLMNKDGFSFFKITQILGQIVDRRDFYAQWKAQGLSVLKLVGLGQHPFLSDVFKAQLLNTGEGIDAIDEQGRTPLMLWVRCNQDIQPFLKYVSLEVLEVKDKTENCVLDYARENNDIVTLKLLEKHKKKLKQKSGFRKLASRLVSKNQGQGQSIGPKPASSLKKTINPRPAVKQNLPPEAATANAIYLDYDSQTGQMKTSYSKTEIQKEAEEKISKADKKRKAKEEKALKKKEEDIPSQSGHSKKSVYEKVKHTAEAVGEALGAVRSIGSRPNPLMGKWMGRTSGAQHLEHLAKAPTVLNVGKGKSANFLEDGSKAGAFKGLTSLAQDVIQAKLKEAPRGHILETLEDIEEAIRKNPQKKIERRKLLEALQWIVGGDIEDGKGSHMNLRFTGGGLTIPRNQRDGSENADIVYIRQVADRIEWNLRALLLGYEMTNSQDSDSFVADKEEPSE